MNVTEITNSKLVTNNEVVNLMGAMGLKLGHKVVPGTLRYGRIIFYCDQDYDGYSIVGLLINFLHKFWPELFEHNMVFKAETPIVVCYNPKTKKYFPAMTNARKEFLKKELFTRYENANWVISWHIDDRLDGNMSGGDYLILKGVL